MADLRTLHFWLREKGPEGGAYRVIHNRSGRCVGEMVALHDGEFVYFANDDGVAWSSWVLEELAELLRRLNGEGTPYTYKLGYRESRQVIWALEMMHADLRRALEKHSTEASIALAHSYCRLHNKVKREFHRQKDGENPVAIEVAKRRASSQG